MLRNRKSQFGFEGVITMVAYLFAAAILIFIMYFAWGEIKTPISTALQSAIPDGETTVNITRTTSQVTGTIGMFDSLYPVFLVGLLISTVVSCLFIRSHPAFFFIMISILAVFIVLGVIFGDVYQEISMNSNFGNTKNSFPVIQLFMQYFPVIVAIIAAIVIFVILAKPGSGSTQGL